ncbi:MAG: prepilin-type N-terminal cleavage/methylation domain-containing protein [Candidatus Zixiibacteriota bacterium]
MYHRLTDRGFTLIEVLMAVVIIGILGAVAMRSLQSGVERSRIRETQNEMDALAMAIAGNPDLFANGLRSDFGYVGDIGALPTTLDDLVTNPGGYATWDGPYVSGRFAEDATGFKSDAWGSAYTFTGGITIASTGGGATPMTRAVASAATDVTNTAVSGTITDAAGNPPGDSSIAITISLTYPDGAGSTTTVSASPGSGGAFTFSGIPIGNHGVIGVYRATDDTVNAIASCLPRTGAVISLRLPGSPFAGSGGGGGGGAAVIEYVPGSAQTTGGSNNDVEFQIFNAGTAGVVISSLTATYAATGYYKKIKWDGDTVFDESNPRAGSGDVVPFTTSKTLGVGETVTISLEEFKTAPTGGSNADMSNVDFTIVFSDGSSITFNSGP